MWLVGVNDMDCLDCGTCAVIWPDWYNNGRRLLVSKTAPEDADWRQRADRIKVQCPGNAITFKQYRPLQREALSVSRSAGLW